MGISYVAKIRGVFDDIRKQGYSRIKPFSVGQVEKRMRDYAKRESVEIAGGGLYMSSNSMAHAMRDSKKRDGVAITEDELAAFPAKRKNMDLYYDKKANLFIYLDEPNMAKYVIHPAYTLQIDRKNQKRVNFITASRMSSIENFKRDRNRYDRV